MSSVGPAVADTDLLARLVVSPRAYRTDEATLISGSLVAVYGAGLSFFRPGCPEAEVRKAVAAVTDGAHEPQELIGAIVVYAADIRNCAGDQLFCVYDTDAEEFQHHADVIGRWPVASSKNQLAKERESRQRSLRLALQDNIVPASNAETLIAALNEAGFPVVP